MKIPIWLFNQINKSYTFQKLFSFIRSKNLYEKYTDVSKEPKSIGIIWMADGKMLQGGLCDRLWGIVTTFNIALTYKLSFYIYFVHPFNLEKYLIPNEYNWTLSDDQPSYNRFISIPFFLPDISKPVKYYKYEKKILTLSENYRQVHVYSNVKELTLDFYSLYHRLFKPSYTLQKVIDESIKNIPFHKYISISFRFMDLLGDFKDIGVKVIESEKEKEILITKCLRGIIKIKKTVPQDIGILVTSDSPSFLQRALSIDSVFVIPGPINHMGFVADDNDGHMKTFLDLYMISRATKVYLGWAGRMYKASFFARTAAMIGNKPFESVNMD